MAEHTEIQKLNAYCYALIHAMRETNAETMTVTQENVTHKGEPIGDYRITVQKVVPEKPKEVIRQVSEREEAVLKCLAEHYDAWEGTCIYTRTIAKETGLTLEQARRSVKALVRKGLAEYHRGLFNDDGMAAGSGYCASKEGALLINACKDCKVKLADMTTGQCQECWEKVEIKVRLQAMESMGIPTGHLEIAKVSLHDLGVLKEHYEKNGVPAKLRPDGALSQINKLVKQYQRHYAI